jgi:hypothetical protein
MAASPTASLFDLDLQDWAAIARIRERLQLNRNTLAVQLANHSLEHQLNEQKAPPGYLRGGRRGNHVQERM